MNKNIETAFIKKFVIPTMQERLTYELASDKKRYIAILRLSYNIDNNNIIFSGSKINEKEILKKIEKTFDLNNQCYIIADRSPMDGTMLSFKHAFREIMDGGSTYILLCGENTVFMKDEVVYGSPMKYILYNK